MISDENLQNKLDEIHNHHIDEMSRNWDVPQTVEFSLKELNMMRTAVTEECTRHYKTHGKYDESMRALMRKLNNVMEDIEQRIINKND